MFQSPSYRGCLCILAVIAGDKGRAGEFQSPSYRGCLCIYSMTYFSTMLYCRFNPLPIGAVSASLLRLEDHLPADLVQFQSPSYRGCLCIDQVAAVDGSESVRVSIPFLSGLSLHLQFLRNLLGLGTERVSIPFLSGLSLHRHHSYNAVVWRDNDKFQSPSYRGCLCICPLKNAIGFNKLRTSHSLPPWHSLKHMAW